MCETIYLSIYLSSMMFLFIMFIIASQSEIQAFFTR